MNSPVTILMLGSLYVVLYGLMSLLRREPLSGQFAVEAIVITLLAAGLASLEEGLAPPLAFLIILYLLTMRVRLSIDLGTALARRGRYVPAARLYALAERLWPDAPGRLIARINQATLSLQQDRVEEAIAVFKQILEQGRGDLGVRNEAAVHFNLGVAYRRNQQEAQAAQEFRAVLEVWPVSEYARRASVALEQGRPKK
jgi:tetratricopeptide (TPR) repeat protein